MSSWALLALSRGDVCAAESIKTISCGHRECTPAVWLQASLNKPLGRSSRAPTQLCSLLPAWLKRPPGPRPGVPPAQLMLAATVNAGKGQQLAAAVSLGLELQEAGEQLKIAAPRDGKQSVSSDRAAPLPLHATSMAAKALLLVVVLLLVGGPPPASAALPPSVITAWFQEAQAVVRTLGIQNQLAGRLYGVLGLAQYNALKAATGNGYTGDLNAVAAVAGHSVLDSLFPWRQGINDLRIQAQLPNITDAELAAVKAIALPEALKVLTKVVKDNYAQWSNFKPAPANTPESIGKYQFTPNQTTALYPQLGDTIPLVVPAKDVRRYTSLYNPHLLISDQYGAELAWITTYGSTNSPLRSAYDTNSPAFWADGANTSTIAGHWLNISWSVLPSDWGLLDTARFHAHIGAAMFDASVACFQVKYTRLFWRPITAIRYGDGARTPQPDWTPLLSTPNHPEYPSGHQCTVGAAAQVLVHYLGNPNVTITIGTENAPSLGDRTYPDVWTAAREVGDSRGFAGVHFNKSNLDGLNLGQTIANAVLRRVV